MTTNTVWGALQTDNIGTVAGGASANFTAIDVDVVPGNLEDIVFQVEFTTAGDTSAGGIQVVAKAETSDTDTGTHSGAWVAVGFSPGGATTGTFATPSFSFAGISGGVVGKRMRVRVTNTNASQSLTNVTLNYRSVATEDV